jgi:hypothetical protein
MIQNQIFEYNEERATKTTEIKIPYNYTRKNLIFNPMTCINDLLIVYKMQASLKPLIVPCFACRC